MLSLSPQKFQRYICISFGSPSTSMIHLIGSRLERKDEEIVSFNKELHHKGNIKSITDVVVDHMHQPWRTFATNINKCLSGKITGLDKMRLMTILSTMRFVSKSEDFQVYGALLSEVMTNQKMRNSHAYNTYLAYATRAATPKKARKFKKPTSLSKKRTLVTLEEEKPEPPKKFALTKNKQDTSIHQAGGLGDGTGSKPGVLDEPKGKFVDTNEGTGLKPGVPDVSKANSFESASTKLRSTVREVSQCTRFAPQLHESAGGLPQNKKTSLSHTAPLQGARGAQWNSFNPIAFMLTWQGKHEVQLKVSKLGRPHALSLTASKKKTPTTTDKSKGIELLSDVVALEAAQLKKVIKRSKQDTSIHQADSSGDGTGSKPGVLDEPKRKFGDSGGEANVQGDDEDVHDSDDDPQQADDERTDSENQETNDDEGESDDKIDKELYSDVNIRLTNAEQDDKGEEHADMTDVAHVQVEQTQEQTTGVQEESGPEMASVQGQSSHSISSNYTNAFFNLENLQSTKMEVVSMLDINVQHEVPRTSQLHSIPVSVILELAIFNPSKTVTTALATTITSLISSLFPNLHQSIPIPTPRNIEATTSTPTVLESETLNAIYLRLSDLEKEVKELKNVDHSSALLSKIKFVVLNAIKEYLETSLDDALYKVLKKHDADIIKEFSILTEIVERLTQQYLHKQSTEKSTKDIRKIKMEHASKQQVP
ncbi:hypothetical protein Tco_1234198 [Tanacetum coccineum]